MTTSSRNLVLAVAMFCWAGWSHAAPPVQVCAIDFEGLPAGYIVDSLSVGAGINGCSESGNVGVTSQNTLFSNDAAIIFDSDCPVILSISGGIVSDCGLADLDLGSPNEDFGGPGVGAGGRSGSPYVNDMALGKILVLAKDKKDVFDCTSLPCVGGSDGLVDDPDDADVPGFARFDFTGINPNGVTIDSVQVMDIEFSEGESPAMITFSVMGGPPSAISVVDTGNNGIATIPLIGLSGVTQMTVEFKGSGAMASAVFQNKVQKRACWATFGGFDSAFVGPEGQKVASFGGNVGPPPSGHLNIVKHATGQHLRVADVEVESCVRDENICASSGSNSPGQPGGKKGFDINVLNFVGTGDLDGVEVSVTGKLVDCGEPAGKKGNDPDRFEILVNGSVFVSDVLGGGNVQLHPPVGNQR